MLTRSWCANASGKITAWVQGELVGEVDLACGEEDVITSLARTENGIDLGQGSGAPTDAVVDLLFLLV